VIKPKKANIETSANKCGKNRAKQSFFTQQKKLEDSDKHFGLTAKSRNWYETVRQKFSNSLENFLKN
jgi:hypothetical protein